MPWRGEKHNGDPAPATLPTIRSSARLFPFGLAIICFKGHVIGIDEVMQRLRNYEVKDRDGKLHSAAEFELACGFTPEGGGRMDTCLETIEGLRIDEAGGLEWSADGEAWHKFEALPLKQFTNTLEGATP